MSELCNIERISEEMFVDYHQMQHFISESPWDHRKLLDQVALDVSSSLPKRKLTGLIIDESGWEKKGDKSVGVAPQYCGNVGKVANSQVAVFGFNIPKKVSLTCKLNAFLWNIALRSTSRFLEWINIKHVNGWHGTTRLHSTFCCRLLS